MSSTALFRWNARDERLEPADRDADAYGAIAVADSWLVAGGRALALDVHRDRFLRSARSQGHDHDIRPFWDAAIREIPRSGDLFPRVDLRTGEGESTLLLHVRPAPVRTASVIVETLVGPDPRTTPTVKGPDFAALAGLRAEAAARGSDEVVILAADGSVIDGASSAIAWWHGSALCVPDADLARVDSVTARSVVTLATALGVDVLHERVRPEELEGREVWALNAVQGIRIVRSWQGGPELAAEPGRLALWRERLATLRRPLPNKAAPS